MRIFRQKQFSLISRGIRFIKELRTLDPLPISFDEFRYFFHGYFKSGILKQEPEEDQIKIQEKIDNFYHRPGFSETIFRLAFGFYRSVYSKSYDPKIESDIVSQRGKFNEGVKISWEKINRLPKRYLSDYIGVGGNGICFDYPFNKIEKIKFSGNFSPREMQLYKRQLQNPLSIFVKVYALEPDQVVLEKLNPKSPKTEQYKKWLKDYTIKTRAGLCWQRLPDWDRLNQELGKDHEFCEFIRKCQSGITEVFGLKNELGDFTTANIAERPETGEMVYFDPIGGNIEMGE